MWKIEYTKRFLKEMAHLPDEVREQAERIAFGGLLARSPLSSRLLEKMKGFPGKYKIRIGDYRMGITLDKKQSLLIFQRVANRKDIYKTFP